MGVRIVDDLAKEREEIDGIDREMARLFAARMRAVGKVAACKLQQGLPVRDPEREAAVLEKGAQLVDERLRPYYRSFQKGVMDVACQYQRDFMNEKAAPGESGVRSNAEKRRQ